MNTILWELKLNIKYLIIYLSIIVIFLIASISKFQIFVDDRELIDTLAQMPKNLQIIMGILPGLKLYILKDYLIMIYYYLNVIIGIYLINTAFILKNNDYKERYFEYTYTRAIAIKRVLLNKYLTGLVITIIISFILFIITLLLCIAYNESFTALYLNLKYFISYVVIYNLAFIINNNKLLTIIYLIGIPIYSIAVIYNIDYLSLLSIQSYFLSSNKIILFINTIVLLLSFGFINKTIKKLAKNDIMDKRG